MKRPVAAVAKAQADINEPMQPPLVGWGCVKCTPLVEVGKFRFFWIGYDGMYRDPHRRPKNVSRRGLLIYHGPTDLIYRFGERNWFKALERADEWMHGRGKPRVIGSVRGVVQLSDVPMWWVPMCNLRERMYGGPK